MEKLLGYKLEVKVREHFMFYMRQYMRESASVLCSYFDMEIKISELQRLNDDCKGSTESYKKLSSVFGCAKFGIVERKL